MKYEFSLSKTSTSECHLSATHECFRFLKETPEARRAWTYVERASWEIMFRWLLFTKGTN
eukprot:1161794-Pelagomonas_calceolata.AAC.2